MKLFKTLFNLATLPVAIVVDTALAIPESACLDPIFERTRRACDRIDESLAEGKKEGGNK